MKKMPKRKGDKTEQIELLRGGSVVSSLTGAFGRTIKETRLTAILGYLMALDPKSFLEKFSEKSCFDDTINSISLESKEENNVDDDSCRSDIRAETIKGKKLIVEAKVGWKDPREQALKMKADWHVLLTQYMPTTRESGNVSYIRWEDIGELLYKLTKSKDRRVKYVSEDLLSYLEENNMIKSKEITEIYTCDFNVKESYSLDIFLKAHLYCETLKGKGDNHLRKLSKVLYFAPNFCGKICQDNPSIQPGISYIAKIINAERVGSWKGLQEAAKRSYGKRWDKKKESLIKRLYGQCCRDRKTKDQFFLFLKKPRHVFNPPVQKNKVKGANIRGKGYLSFEGLFSA